MDHRIYRRPEQQHHMHGNPQVGNGDRYDKGGGNAQTNFWSPHRMINPNTSHEQIMNDFGNFRSPVKRQREHHVIIASPQDDDNFNCNDDQGDDNSMMDCDNNPIGPNKRRRFAYTFPFDNTGQVFQIQQKQEDINTDTNGSTVIEDYPGMNIASESERISPGEWWRKKRTVANNTSLASAAIDSKSLTKQEAPSSCCAMDTSASDDEVYCHICQKKFPLPTIPSVREVMPANALLNYFSPLNKKRTSNVDVAMATDDSHPTTGSSCHRNSPAYCSCCDRPSCPECRRECEVCQKSFCSFCSIVGDRSESNACFCLDCNERLR